MKLIEAYNNCMPCLDCNNAEPLLWKIKAYRTPEANTTMVMCQVCGAAYDLDGQKIEYYRGVTELKRM